MLEGQALPLVNWLLENFERAAICPNCLREVRPSREGFCPICDSTIPLTSIRVLSGIFDEGSRALTSLFGKGGKKNGV